MLVRETLHPYSFQEYPRFQLFSLTCELRDMIEQSSYQWTGYVSLFTHKFSQFRICTN